MRLHGNIFKDILTDIPRRIHNFF